LVFFATPALSRKNTGTFRRKNTGTFRRKDTGTVPPVGMIWRAVPGKSGFPKNRGRCRSDTNPKILADRANVER